MYPNLLSHRTHTGLVLTTAHVLASCFTLLVPTMSTAGMVVLSNHPIQTSVKSSPKKTEIPANGDKGEWGSCVKNLNTAALQSDWTPTQRLALLNQCN